MIRPALVAAACALALTACTSTVREPAPSPTTSTSASQREPVTVSDPRLLLNDDGTATLDATFRMSEPGWRPTAATPEDCDAVCGHVFSRREAFPAGPVPVGSPTDEALVWFEGPLRAGDRVVARIDLQQEESGRVDDVTLSLRVERRAAGTTGSTTPRLDGVRISVRDAVIGLVPGQRKAYVGGTVVSTVDDGAYVRPTARRADGSPVAWRHQTATGGPYGFIARRNTSVRFGGPPWKEFSDGDADYLDARRLRLGEVVTARIPFESGPREVPFTVVRR